MSHRDDEMNRRRQRREEMRQKAHNEQKRLKAGLIVAAILLVVCTVGMISIIRDTGVELEIPTKATEAPTKPTEATQPLSLAEQNKTSTIHIRAAGDLNVTDSVVASGLSVVEGYEFTKTFIDVAPLLAEADLTVLNLEGNIVGEPYGTERTSAPNQLLQALRSAGVDLRS